MKFSGHKIFNNTPIEVVVDDGRVQSIREVAYADSTTWIAPALIDIQVNGFAGFELNTAADVCAMVRAVWRVGTGFLCPTVITASFENIGNSLRAVVEACEMDAMVAHAILGIHLEGPYISYSGWTAWGTSVRTRQSTGLGRISAVARHRRRDDSHCDARP